MRDEDDDVLEAAVAAAQAITARVTVDALLTTDLDLLPAGQLLRRAHELQKRALDAERRVDAAEQARARYEALMEQVADELKMHREYNKRKLEGALEGGLERKIELLLQPGADETETRKVAHLILERDRAQAMKQAVADAIDECVGRMGARQPIDVESVEPSGTGVVKLVVDRENGAWVREFGVPLNYALRYLDVLGQVWVRHIEDRYVAKMGTALQKRKKGTAPQKRKKS